MGLDKGVQGTHFENCYKVHHACALAYIEELETVIREYMTSPFEVEVQHIDGDPQNNHIENLRVVRTGEVMPNAISGE